MRTSRQTFMKTWSLHYDTRSETMWQEGETTCLDCMLLFPTDRLQAFSLDSFLPLCDYQWVEYSILHFTFFFRVALSV
jgi:hypothetical protein